MFLKSYLGILGDPAKLEKYSDDFYGILKSKNSEYLFHLIGASERDVTKKNYQDMYNKFKLALGNTKFLDFNLFRISKNSKNFRSRIGLFPSGVNQLILGPDFVFAPYPANSNSRYLKFKARYTISIFSRLSKHNLVKIAYFPIGGKAAERTKSNSNDLDKLRFKFKDAFENSWFDWIYLEAGSGEELLEPEIVESIIAFDRNQVIKDFMNKLTSNLSTNIEKIIIPNTIYGGGINSPAKIKSLLEPRGSEPIIVPECIIIGNVSEKNISVTYDIIDIFEELNQIPSYKPNRLIKS